MVNVTVHVIRVRACVCMLRRLGYMVRVMA
jgi:hypothetical protein